VAASNNKYEHLEVLLKCGADPNVSDGFSNCINVARKRNINPSDGKYIIYIFVFFTIK